MGPCVRSPLFAKLPVLLAVRFCAAMGACAGVELTTVTAGVTAWAAAAGATTPVPSPRTRVAAVAVDRSFLFKPSPFDFTAYPNESNRDSNRNVRVYPTLNNQTE